MNVRLIRVSEVRGATYGLLLFDGEPRFCTLEEPWKGNERNVSCIPVGAYTCKRVTSPSFGNTFEVTNVPGRSHILFHYGNTTKDTRGCILIGTSFGEIDGAPAVLNSRRGHKLFLDKLANTDEWILDIISLPRHLRCLE